MYDLIATLRTMALTINVRWHVIHNAFLHRGIIETDDMYQNTLHAWLIVKRALVFPNVERDANGLQLVCLSSNRWHKGKELGIPRGKQIVVMEYDENPKIYQQSRYYLKDRWLYSDTVQYELAPNGSKALDRFGKPIIKNPHRHNCLFIWIKDGLLRTTDCYPSQFFGKISDMARLELRHLSQLRDVDFIITPRGKVTAVVPYLSLSACKYAQHNIPRLEFMEPGGYDTEGHYHIGDSITERDVICNRINAQYHATPVNINEYEGDCPSIIAEMAENGLDAIIPNGKHFDSMRETVIETLDKSTDFLNLNFALEVINKGNDQMIEVLGLTHYEDDATILTALKDYCTKNHIPYILNGEFSE